MRASWMVAQRPKAQIAVPTHFQPRIARKPESGGLFCPISASRSPNSTLLDDRLLGRFDVGALGIFQLA